MIINRETTRNQADSLPEPLPECQLSSVSAHAGQTWVSPRPPLWGGGRPSADTGLSSAAPPGALYLYLWAPGQAKKCNRKLLTKGINWLVSLVQVSKHLHQISNYLTFPLQNLTTLEHLNLNFQVTLQQVDRKNIFSWFSSLITHLPRSIH